MRGKWLLSTGIVLFLAAGAGALSWWRAQQPASETNTVVEPELASGSDVALQGVVEAISVVSVPAPVNGVLEDFPVKPGDEVAEGQLLGRIRNASLEEQTKESQAELETAINKRNAAESTLIATRLEESRASADASRAMSELQRTERIYQRQSVLNREGATPRRLFEAAEKDYQTAKSDQETLSDLASKVRERVTQHSNDLEAAQKAVADAEAELEKARNDLESASLHSPVDGIIINIQKQAGEEVKKGTPDLITIGVDLAALHIKLEPDPKLLSRIKAGQPVLVQMPEIPGEGVPGVVSAVAEKQIVVDFASPTPQVRPGMTATVRLKVP